MTGSSLPTPPGSHPGKAIVRAVKAGRRRREDLTQAERLEALLWLRGRGATYERIGAVLGVSRSNVWHLMRQAGALAMAEGFDPAASLASLAQTIDEATGIALRAAHAAEKDGKWADAGRAAWSAVKSGQALIAALQSMGVVPKAAERVEVDVRVTERVKVVFAVVLDAIYGAVPDPAVRQQITDAVRIGLADSPETAEYVSERREPVPASRPEPDDAELDEYLGLAGDEGEASDA